MTACAALAVASGVWALRLLWLWAHCLSGLCGVRVMSRGEDGHLQSCDVRARRLAQGAVGAPTLTSGSSPVDKSAFRAFRKLSLRYRLCSDIWRAGGYGSGSIVFTEVVSTLNLCFTV